MPTFFKFFKNIFLKFFTFIFFLFFIVPSYAKVDLLPYGSEFTILISEEITIEDFDDFKSVINQVEKSKKTLHMNSIQLNSNGGNADIGMEIGKIIREKKYNAYVSEKSICNSACVFILLGGISRYPFGKIGIHRPTYYINVIKDNKILKDTNETLTKTKKYIEKMGISSQLYDAIYHTEPWEIRYLTGKEKKDWGVFGNDIYYEEYLIGKLATDRHISHSESITIFSKNFNNCLDIAKQFNTTVFDCLKDKKAYTYSKFDIFIKKIIITINEWLGVKQYQLSYLDNIEKIKKDIRRSSIYLREMEITEENNNNQNMNSLDNDYVKYLETNNIWWITENRLYINLDNSSDKDIKKILFRLSDMDCNNKTQKILRLSFDLHESLGKFDHEVYVGELPFDFIKKFSKGKKCGVIESASY